MNSNESYDGFKGVRMPLDGTVVHKILTFLHEEMKKDPSAVCIAAHDIYDKIGLPPQKVDEYLDKLSVVGLVNAAPAEGQEKKWSVSPAFVNLLHY